MDPIVPYIACVVGCAGLFLMLQPGRRPAKVAGALIGLGVFAWMLVAAVSVSGGVVTEPDARPGVFFTIFSLIAVASAVCMITHQKPVYSALYFVMVVLSSAGLFLMLQAEFMAFALVIVYAGAILITYMFVLMLAQQAPDAEHEGQQPEYDRVPREPIAGVVVGFIMLALLSRMTYEGTAELPAPSAAKVAAMDGNSQSGTDASDNIHGVGMALIRDFPVSLELAGVILLMAMFGAVVLARKQIELGEDEVREAAGMRRLALHGDDTEHVGPVTGDAGGRR